MACHLARFGALGEIAGFTSVDGARFPRGARVVLRTSRGLELGEVLAPPDAGGATREMGDIGGQLASGGSILRGMTAEDALLEARLDKNRRQAFDACEKRLAALDLPAALIDVESLFDGRTLCFYFLGPMTPELEQVTSELAETYEAQAQLRRFADTLTAGCGPGCGTEDGSSCQSCGSGCAVAEACSTGPRRRKAQD